MQGASAVVAAYPPEAPPSAGRALTAGEIARHLGIDIKTVHNWARGGRAACWRTTGRHLRFHPVEALRLVRQRGLPVPPELVLSCPRLVTAGLGNEAPEVWATRRDSIFSALVEFGSGAFDVLVVHLDRIGTCDVSELAQSVRSHDLVGGRALLGISEYRSVREAFMAAGADDSVADARCLSAALDWVAGTSSVRGSSASVPRSI